MKLQLKTYLFPLVFIFLLILIQFISWIYDISFSKYGIYPLSAEGFIGVFTFPLIHGDWLHLFSNSFALILLLGVLFSTFKSVSYLVFFVSYLLPGVFTWFIGRPSFHIGASGMVYSLIGFMLCIGLFTRKRNMLALSLLILFLHGGFIWGLLPQNNNVSWETHLGGFLVGGFLAYFFKDFTFLVNERNLVVEENVEYSEQTSTESSFEYTYTIKKKSGNNTGL